MFLVNVFIKKLMKKSNNFTSIWDTLFLRLTCHLTLIQMLSLYTNIIVKHKHKHSLIHNSLILIELSRVPVPVPTKIHNLLPVSLGKSANYRYEPKSCFSCCYLFVSLWHCSMALSYLSSDDGLIFFCFSFCGTLNS